VTTTIDVKKQIPCLA